MGPHGRRAGRGAGGERPADTWHTCALAPRQEARAPEDAARLETGRGGLGEHDGQRQHRHRGLLATRPACRRTPRRPRARSGPPATPARAPPPSAVSFSARPFPRQHTHYLYVTRTPGSVRNAALKINDRRVRRLCWRACRPTPRPQRAPPAARGQQSAARPPRRLRTGASAVARFQDGGGAASAPQAETWAGRSEPAGGMLRAALGRVSTLVGCARPRGPGLRRLWGRGARPPAARKRRACDWGWRPASSEPGPRATHYQLVYTCKVGARRGRGRARTRLCTARRASVSGRGAGPRGGVELSSGARLSKRGSDLALGGWSCSHPLGRGLLGGEGLCRRVELSKRRGRAEGWG